MTLIKANIVKFTEKNPFPKGEIVGTRWMIIGDKFQVAFLKGKGFKAKNISGIDDPSYLVPSRFFPTLKEALEYARSF